MVFWCSILKDDVNEEIVKECICMNSAEKSGLVIIKLQGGLGNQLFQYAAGYSLAKKTNRKFVMDLSHYEKSGSRSYQLDKLHISATAWDGQVPNKILSRLLTSKLFSLKSVLKIYKEYGHHFDPVVDKISHGQIYLKGFFQSSRYFMNFQNDIRSEFSLKRPLDHFSGLWKNRICNSKNSVAIHIRRGDYITNHTAAAIHGQLTLDYYRRAMDLMSKILDGNPQFYVFSDDTDFAEQSFSGIRNLHVVKNQANRSWEDMFLMASCNNFIIANSSYSWWGAWLNRSKKNVIIAPAQWFSAEKLQRTNTLDIYEDDWIILK